jgi:hypothetical protein
VAEDRGAERPRHEAYEECGEREERTGIRISLGEELLRKNERGRDAEEEEVVQLDDRADCGCEACATKLSPSIDRGCHARRRNGV